MLNRALNFPHLWSFLLSIFGRDDVVLSVGSGRGSVEGKIADECKCKFICIDPNPTSFQKPKNGFREIAPDFPTVREFKKTPSSISKMLLNWVTPDHTEMWDLDAINMVEPEEIVVVSETNGGAGTQLFLYWLQHFVNLNGFEPTFSDKLHPSNRLKTDEDTQLLRDFYRSREMEVSDEQKKFLESLPKYKIIGMAKKDEFRFLENLSQSFLALQMPRIAMSSLMGCPPTEEDLEEITKMAELCGWDQSCLAVIHLKKE